MSIFTVLSSIWNFLFNNAKKQWDKLPAETKAALLGGSGYTQIFKDNLDLAETELKKLASAKLGLPIEVINKMTDELLVQFNVKTVAELQSLLKSAENTLHRNGILTTIASVASIFLSGGKLTWESLLFGLLQFAYKQFIK